MRHVRIVALVGAAFVTLPLLSAPGDELDWSARVHVVDPGVGVPEDLVRPEGKSRWHLEAIATSASLVRSLRVVEDGTVAGPSANESLVDPRGGDAALRWAFPHKDADALRPGAIASFALERHRDDEVERIWIETRQVGIGWVHLPSGPREVVLQRALVQRQDENGRYVPARLTHRWVDPRAGVVAEVSGPVSADGRSRLSIGEASVVDEVLAGAADLTIHVDELDFPRHERVRFGWNTGQICVDGTDDGQPCTSDAECGTTGSCGNFVSTLTPEGYATIAELVAANQWDFTPAVSGCTTAPPDPGCKEIISTSASFKTCSLSMTICDSDLDCPGGETCVSAGETCNESSCGYGAPGTKLERADNDPGTAGWTRNNQVSEREQRVSDFVIWLRSGSQKEGVAGAFGAGESRFCWVSDAQATRTPVPLWRFPSEDADGWFVQTGDSWQAGPFNCEQSLFNNVCGDNGSGLLRVKGCDSGAFSGTQGGEVIKGGVLTLPSGHTVNALLVRTLAEFCVYLDCNCDGFLCFPTNRVRTVIYLWQTPHLGTVALLRSKNRATSVTDWGGVVKLADIKTGLFPPVSITAGATTETTVDLSWDPGNDMQHINRYKIYWDTDSGGASDYAFNSDDNAGQVAFAGTSATISGLDPGEDYFFTVTSISDFTNPSTSVTRSYESIRFPTQVSGDPSFVYPVEVQAGTDCPAAYRPTDEVTGLTVDKPAGGGVELCWNALTNRCLQGYTILGASSPELETNFHPIVDLGAVTCWSGNPAESYFLVVARGAGGTGPWGHFGR